MDKVQLNSCQSKIYACIDVSTYIKVVQLELSKAGVQGSLDNLGAVLAA